jgi:hypothetical protein
MGGWVDTPRPTCTQRARAAEPTRFAHVTSEGIQAKGGGLSARTVDPTTLNGLAGFVFQTAEGTETLAFEVAHGSITAIYAVRNPDKLRHLS